MSVSRVLSVHALGSPARSNAGTLPVRLAGVLPGHLAIIGITGPPGGIRTTGMRTLLRLAAGRCSTPATNRIGTACGVVQWERRWRQWGRWIRRRGKCRTRSVAQRRDLSDVRGSQRPVAVVLG